MLIRDSKVFGPIIHEVTDEGSLNTSCALFLNVLKGGVSDEGIAKSAGCWVDVRDLAEAHVRAIQVEEAGRSRYILSAGWCSDAFD